MSDAMPRIQRYVVYFDKPVKAWAVKQYMDENLASFDQATGMLGMEHGVDFLYMLSEET